MVDPREIRVGNWVMKITGTDTNTQSFFEYQSITLDEYYYTFAKFCFPIKLSPVILGKCGFKHEFGDWYKNLEVEDIDDGLPFLRCKHADGCWYLREVKIPAQPMYLHQLQNLFYSLSNRELIVHLGHFENTAMIGPIDFFIKPVNTSTIIRGLL